MISGTIAILIQLCSCLLFRLGPYKYCFVDQKKVTKFFMSVKFQNKNGFFQEYLLTFKKNLHLHLSS